MFVDNVLLFFNFISTFATHLLCKMLIKVYSCVFEGRNRTSFFRIADQVSPFDAATHRRLISFTHHHSTVGVLS
uniref:Putative secreted protein n=1 Tax=Anopheles marajoara TaxID=58244 RepID=A0A2M4CDW2_9DIPT